VKARDIRERAGKGKGRTRRVSRYTSFWYLRTGKPQWSPELPRNTSIVLSDELLAFVEREVVSGRYASSSEVVREGLRLLEDRALKRERVREALIAGEESGPAEAFDLEAFLAKQHAAGTSDG